MKTSFEISDLRKQNEILYGLKDLDKKYVFYYDETNNIRKFYLKDDDFNSSYESNFILGGVLHEGLKYKANLIELTDGLKLQKSSKEIKLKHLAKGDFCQCLKSKKLNYFLNWLLKSDLFVHCSSLNLLYFSVVDIVDSAIINFKGYGKLDRGYIDLMKNDLYRVAKIEKESVTRLFYNYEYPNIKKDKVADFINELINIISPYETIDDFHLGITSLRQLLQQSQKANSLLFVMDEEDFILQKDFSLFFITRIYTFINSDHIFDREDSIEEIINNFEITNNGKPFSSYKFVNSDENQLIQISDVFIGLLGKFSTFINTNSKESLAEIINRMTPIQIQNLELLENILNKSFLKNKAFLHAIDSYEENEKYEFVEFLISNISLE